MVSYLFSLELVSGGTVSYFGPHMKIITTTSSLLNRRGQNEGTSSSTRLGRWPCEGSSFRWSPRIACTPSLACDGASLLSAQYYSLLDDTTNLALKNTIHLQRGNILSCSQ